MGCALGYTIWDDKFLDMKDLVLIEHATIRLVILLMVRASAGNTFVQERCRQVDL